MLDTYKYNEFLKKYELYTKLKQFFIINNMDWYVIEYLYPKAYKKFVETMFPNMGVISVSVLKNFDIKKLYYFFDKQGYYLILELNQLNQWSFTLKKDKWVICENGDIKNSREEIEEIGFNYCFKQMEASLDCNKTKV